MAARFQEVMDVTSQFVNEEVFFYSDWEDESAEEDRRLMKEKAATFAAKVGGTVQEGVYSWVVQWTTQEKDPSALYSFEVRSGVRVLDWDQPLPPPNQKKWRGGLKRREVSL